MIPTYLLGRYECVDHKINAKRVWHIVHDQSRDIYIVSYGRMGNRAVNIEYKEQQAWTKIKSKIKASSKRPAYVKREGFEEVIGSMAVNFIADLAREFGDK